ncbi:MAG: Mce-associated rane protein [Actinomycetota bacterium]|nr:Mce-associated rane protein [Actinomycetota bacterium]
MTTPADHEPASQPSDTGWPSDPPLPPPPVAVQPEPEAVVQPEPEAFVQPEPEAYVQPEPDPFVEPEPEPEPEPELEPEPEAYVEPEAEPASIARAGRAPLIALVLTVVLMALATGFVWYRVQRADQIETARQAALEASRDAAAVLLSYDYRTLDKDFSAGKAVTTGAFRTQYASTTSKVVAPVAKEKKAVVKAEVVTAGIVRATPDTVVTIVYVNQVTTSSLQTGPKVDLSRVRMTLKHVSGRWLVSKVEAL